METETDAPEREDTAMQSDDQQTADKKEQSELLKKIARRIKDDKEYHKPAFKRMREDMNMAMWGRDEKWEGYTANIVGRHVKQKTAALYAKNPKVVARRRPTLDFAVWEEDMQSLQGALMLVQQAGMVAQAAAAQPPTFDAMTGEPIPAQPPQIPGVQEAQQLLQDVQQGLERRKMVKRIGQTLELLFQHAMVEQQPLDFKSALKSVVRRCCTTGVGYVELGFQRENGPRPTLQSELDDARKHLEYLQSLNDSITDEQDGESDGIPLEQKIEEATAVMEALQAEPEIVLREGLVFDYPMSTYVIPDKNTQALVGFVGGNHITVELPYTKQMVHDRFGVDLKDSKVKTYRRNENSRTEQDDQFAIDFGDEYKPDPSGDVVCVQKHYDKAAGLMYVLVDGHDEFLEPPKKPDVRVEGFFPVFALTFNACEHEDQLFPPSDVRLLADAQREFNRSREGMRAHRQARRPRWAVQKGLFGEGDVQALSTLNEFGTVELNFPSGTKLADVLQAIPVPGVDPNLYETGQIFGDMQVVAGTQQAQLGGVSKSTATESAIAESSNSTADGAAIDDLDAFLTRIARAGGQVLFEEMSEEKVMEVCGPGAVWPQLSIAEIQRELFLEVEAGSTGKPNQAMEVKNMQMMLPFLLQIPGIQPMWLAKEALRRLDDRLDLTEALAAGIPSIVMQNQMKQAGTGDPASDPAQQGPQGGDNAPKGPERQAGSDAPMGDNRQTAYGPGSTGAA